MSEDFEMIPSDWDMAKGATIKVIGVGGGGNNAVNYMANLGITGVDFIVCNTDGQVLKESPIRTKIQLGGELTHGRGAGCDPRIGKQAAIESEEKIRQILSDNTEMVFITAGMGGGTGTGATPVIARIAKEMEILTVAIVTLPFKDEGVEPNKRAIEGIADLKEHVDSLLLISNNKLYEIYGDLRVREAFKKADGILATAAKGIAEIITNPGYINVDFADVKKVMKNSGVALMGMGTASGSQRAIEAVKEALSSPLLNNNSIKGATNILVNITSSEKDEIKLSELGDIMEYIKREAGTIQNMKRGVVYDANFEDQISVTIVATGFKMKDIPELYVESKKKEIERVTLDVDSIIDYKQQAIDFVVEKTDEDEQEREYEDEMIFEMEEEPVCIKSCDMPETTNNGEQRRDVGQKLTGLKKQEVAYLENIPAYKRKQIEIENDQLHSSQNVASEMLEDSTDNKFVLRSNNSYLNPEVD